MQSLRLADAIDVLLIVGAGRADDLRLAAEDLMHGLRRRRRHRPVAIGHGGRDAEEFAHVVAETGTLCGDAVEQRFHFALHGIERFFDEEAAVDDDAAGIRHARRGQAFKVFAFAAMHRIDVHGRLPRTVGHDGHVGMARRQRGIKIGFELLQHRRHVADGAVAQERHRAVRDAAQRFDLRPPHAAMADADAVDVQGLGNDHVIDARLREPAAFGEISHAAIAAGFFIDRSGNLDGAGQFDAGIDQRFDRHDRRCDAALHIARAAAIDLAVAHDAAERIDRPARARLHHVEMAVEMHAGP